MFHTYTNCMLASSIHPILMIV